MTRSKTGQFKAKDDDGKTYTIVEYRTSQQSNEMGENRKPYSNDMPMLSDNRSRYTTRTGIIRASVIYSGIRSQSRTMPKYQDWANDVLDHAAVWFETEIENKNYLKSSFE
jgi:hypothetical protein